MHYSKSFLKNSAEILLKIHHRKTEECSKKSGSSILQLHIMLNTQIDKYISVVFSKYYFLFIISTLASIWFSIFLCKLLLFLCLGDLFISFLGCLISIFFLRENWESLEIISFDLCSFLLNDFSRSFKWNCSSAYSTSRLSISISRSFLNDFLLAND